MTSSVTTRFGLAGAVHVAQALLTDEALLDRAYLARMGLEDRLDGWRALAQHTRETVAV